MRDEMKCKNCNKEIEYVNCHYFDQRVDPVSLGAYESEEYYQAEIKGGGEEAYYINVPTFITALEFTDSIPDLVDSISCPECDEFPFNSPGVDLYNETVDMVFMGEEQLKLKLNDCIITSIEGGSVDVSPTCLHAGVVKNGLTILKLSSLKVNL